MSKLDEDSLNQAPKTITDEQIVTEKSVPRRFFLTATGAVLVGGAAALVLGTRAIGQSEDPDKAKAQDPDKAKAHDPDKAKTKRGAKTKSQDPDKAKTQDPDKAKTQDPDKAKVQDPDKPK